MNTDEKSELTSEILDYVWYKVLDKKTTHTLTANETDYYVKDAGDMWGEIYDIIDNYIEEDNEKI